MAEDSDGTLKAVVICEGDLHDPDFPKKFRSLLGKLKSILDPPKRRKRFLKVNKVEPWNSVRVTLSIPKEAASKLRQLAAEGSAALRALGILSVQLEGDTVISLRLVGQEIVLRTESENTPALIGQNRSSVTANDFTNLLARVPTPQSLQPQQLPPQLHHHHHQQQQHLQLHLQQQHMHVQQQQPPPPPQTICAGSGEGPSGLSTAIKTQQIIRVNSIDQSTPINGPLDAKAIFKSPNTICPMDGKLPTPVPSNIIETQYPFESMTQARVIQRRENTMGHQNQTLMRPAGGEQQPTPPPPYPGASPTQCNANVNNVNMMNAQTHIVTNKIAIQPQPQPSTSANIAISSPLLVNLLQNEPTAGAVATSSSPSSSSSPTASSSSSSSSSLSSLQLPPTSMPSTSTSNVPRKPNFLPTLPPSGVVVGKNYVISNTSSLPSALVKKEVVILSNNSMPPHPMQQQQQQQVQNHSAPNFVMTNSKSGTELEFNKCIVNKQAIQSPSPHHQMRVQQQFVSVSSVQSVQSTINESIQQPQQPQQPTLIHSNNNNGKDNSSNSERNLNNSSVLSTVPQQQQQQANNIVIAGNATTVPSTINSMNKLQTRYPQQQSMPPQFQQPYSNQSTQIRAQMMPAQNVSTPQGHHLNQQPMTNMISIPPNQLNTSPQNITAQVLQKQQQMRSMHPNVLAQQQQQQQHIINTSNVHQVEFRQPVSANVVLQQNQMQQFQPPLQQQQHPHQQSPQQMLQPQLVAGNTIQFNTPSGSQQPPQSQMEQSFATRWPLKPMDSATQSSFQEFTRYQMQYNLSQQQQQVTPEDSIADQLADLDEITRTDLESLLPSINDTDLDTALGLDMKPLESLLDAKDLELDLIDPSVNADAIETAPAMANVLGGAGIPPPTTNVVNTNHAAGGPPPNANIMVQHFQQNQAKISIQQQQQSNQMLDTNMGMRYRQIPPMAAADNKRTLNVQQMQPNNSMMNVPPNVVTSTPLMQSKPIPNRAHGPSHHHQTNLAQHHHQQLQQKFEQKSKPIAGKEKQVLINPLTGELEPIPSDDSGDEMASAVGPQSLNEFHMDATSNSIYSDDDNSCSTFSKTSDHSDNDRSSNSEYSGKGKNSGKRKDKKDSLKKPKTPKEKGLKGSLLKEKLQQGLKEKILGKSKEKGKIKNLPSPVISNATIAETSEKNNPEKIKLRLKLEKSEPVTSAYKVDVSFGDGSKRAQSVANAAGSSTSPASTTNNAINTSSGGSNEEPRVPPLHISLRGKNSIVIKNSKKGRKKSQSVNAEDDGEKKLNKKSSLSTANTSMAKIDPNQSINNRLHHSNCSPNVIPSPNKNANTSTNSNANLTPNKLDHIVDGSKFDAPLLEKTDSNISETSKRLNSDLIASTNGPVQLEKKRRFSQSSNAITAASGTIAPPGGGSADSAKVSLPSITIGTTLVSSRSAMTPMTDNSVESIREAIGSTNVGTLPKHSPLAPSKVQKSTNNNNNSLTPNKAKPANKVKTKTLINMLNKPHSDPTIAVATQSGPMPEKSEPPNDYVPQEMRIDAIADEQTDREKCRELNAIAENSSPSKISQIELNSTGSASDDAKKCTDQNNVAIAANTTDNIVQNSNAADVKSHEKEIEDDKETREKTSTMTTTATTTLPSNAQYVNQQSIEAKDSPRRDILEGIINASQAIRCSPASQAQGEDSGIESMDALSEKSPHQTASPQTNYVKRAESPKEMPSSKATTPDEALRDNLTADKYSNIEAALAKMEGLNEFMASDCDKSAVEVDAVACDTQKMNGEHLPLQTDKQVELLMNDLAEPTKEKPNEILIAALNEGGDFKAEIGSNKADTIESSNALEERKDLNENQTIVEVLKMKNNIDDAPVIDGADKIDDIKMELTTTPNEIETVANSKSSDIVQDVLSETATTKDTLAESTVGKEEPMDQQPPDTVKLSNATAQVETEIPTITTSTTIETSDSKQTTETAPASNDVDPIDSKSEEDKEIEDTMKTMDNNLSESKTELLQQLSIEIPSNEGDSTQRVRTRASSKLESPLDASKQSPSDSPASFTRSVKGTKRKRHESESSTQSNVSDDMPIRNKKLRKSGGDLTASSSTSSSPTNLRSGGGQTKEATPTNALRPIYTNDSENILNRKSEDSSDSDEPLIDVADKVRNAKLCKVILEGGEKMLRNHQKSAADGQNSGTNNVSHSGGDGQNKQAILVGKVDDKSSAMSTRRSVRMNMGSKVSKGSINQNSHGLNLNSNENHNDTRKSGNGVTVASANSIESGSSMDARRKTRSAGLDAAVTAEGRRRRLSRESAK